MDYNEQLEKMCSVAYQLSNQNLEKELAFAEMSRESDEEEDPTVMWWRVLKHEKRLRGL